MDKSSLRKAISKKLREKWGYSKHQIDVYWEAKNKLSEDELKKELEDI